MPPSPFRGGAGGGVKMKDYKHRFTRLFSEYLNSVKEEYLADIAVLGDEILQNGVPPEDIAEIFEESLNVYAKSEPKITLAQIADRISVPLVELLMAYGMAFRKQVYERTHLATKIIENTPEGVWMTDAAGNALITNPAFSAITGYSSEEITGKNLSFLLRLDKAGIPSENNIRRLTEGTGHWKGEITSRRKGGETYRAILNITAIRDVYGKVTDYVGILDDITEEKQREELFRMELSRAKKIYDMVISLDLPMTKWAEITVRCLPAENFGGDTLDIIAPSENSLLIFLADVTGHGVAAAMTANTLKTMFREISATTLSPAVVCSRLNRAMSKTILPDDIIATFCALLDIETMRLTYCLAGLPNPMILRDEKIIRLRPTGMPLGVFEETVYHEKDIILQKDDLLLAFTDGIPEARNFRGEIFGLSGIEKSILSPLPQPLPETERGVSPLGRLSLIDAVLDNAIKFQNKLSFQDDLILISIKMVNAESGEMPLNSFHTERKSILSIKTRHADIDAMIPKVMYDICRKMVLEKDEQGKLTIALFETIANAVEHGNLELSEFKRNIGLYNEEEFKHICHQRRDSDMYGDRRILIETYYGTEEIEISVQDDGRGFDVKAVPDPTNIRNLDRPTGRGIYLLRKSVDRVAYNSKGNKVVFSKRIKAHSLFEAGWSEIKDIRVLMVEDDLITSRINRLTLEKSGYNIVGVAEDGKQAMEMVRSRIPDVILMDYMLPDVDGIELTRQIQEIRPTPVVMLTNYTEEDLSEKAYLSGIGAFLIKPPRINEITQAISVAMARFNDISELRSLNKRLQTEIAERKRTEDIMQKREKEYYNLFESSPFGIFRSTVEGKLIRANSALAEILGYNSPEELISIVNTSNIAEKLYADPTQRPVFIRETVKDADDWHVYENRCRCKDGSIIITNLFLHVVPDNDGSPKYLKGFVEDITERKQMEESLKKSEEQLRLAIEASTHAIYDWNMYTDEVYFSPYFYTMLGYEPYEMPSSYDTWLNLLHPDEMDDVLNIFNEYIMNKRECHKVEIRMKTKSGEWKRILGRGKVIERDKISRHLRIVGTYVDVTPQ
ncbi:MAG TPA: hypothetical protein DCQ37_06540 [Desulfobacteraceae bacterium]|nr:hypothetical protein [Desulfobacteraceae bacterium]